MNHFHLIVIGSGPAGQRAALQGAKAGKKVAIIEEYSAMGGGCVHFGTLPSKSFRESVYRYSLGSRGTLGQEAEHVGPKSKKNSLPDIKRLWARKDRVIAAESQVVFSQLKRNGVTMIHGRGRLVSAHEVQVLSKKGQEKIKADYIFIATGARPVAPSHLPIDGKIIHDSNTILSLKTLPKSIVVLGAGIIGCEYASMFSTAGAQVHLVDKRHEILAAVDREIVNHLVERFEHQGMKIHLETEGAKLHKRGSKFAAVHLTNGEKVAAEIVLVAQGRSGNTDGLGLEDVGVERDSRGLIKVDAHFKTTVANIYAVGDVVGPPALASTSMEEGRIAACHALQIDAHEMPKHFPYGIYTIPEISMMGATQEELEAKKTPYVAGKARYKELARGQIVGDRWGLLKLMVDKKTLRLLGLHIVGDSAAELIHIGQAVMAFGGDIQYFIHNVFNYPTLAEAYKTAAFHAVNQISGKTSMR